MKRDGIEVTSAYIDWAGVAVMKRTYHLFRERGYRTRLLGAAFRQTLHWSEFIGGDLILTIPHDWQVRLNASDVAVRSRIDDAVDPRILDQLLERLPDFRRAYELDGMPAEDLEAFGPTVRTLRTFIESWHDTLGAVRDFVLPDPGSTASTKPLAGSTAPGMASVGGLASW